jgi:hypothetical protein
MTVIKMFATSITASLLLGAVAHARDPQHGGDTSALKSAAVTGASLPWNVATFQRVAPVKAQHSVAPDWTSLIGTGTAAARGPGVESVKRVSLVTSHYPEAPRSSLIGTGTAAIANR